MNTVISNTCSRAAMLACLGMAVVGCSKKEEPPPAPSPNVPAPAPVDALHEAAPANTVPTVPAEPPGVPPSAPSGKLAADSQCAGICTRSTELGCSQAGQCERLCHDTMAGAPCSSEMKVATACMLAHPISDWECTPDGLAAIKDGVCVAEQEAVTGCVSKMLGGGSP